MKPLASIEMILHILSIRLKMTFQELTSKISQGSVKWHDISKKFAFFGKSGYSLIVQLVVYKT